MADYTDLPDTAVGVGGTPSGTTVTALRDNPIAIAEGATGAPRIQTAAIEGGAVTTAKLASNERMTTGNVVPQIAGASAGAVGSYAFLGTLALNASSKTFGETLAGSSLYPAGIRTDSGDGFSDPAPSADVNHTGQNSPRAGTWRCMGVVSTNDGGRAGATLWLRIS